MPTVLERADTFRAELIAREEAAVSRLLVSYTVLYADLEAELLQLQADVEKARESGRTISQSWLRRQQRLRNLIAQTEAEVSRISRELERTLIAEQQALIPLAEQHARQLMLDALGPAPRLVVEQAPFNRLQPRLVEQLVGALADGSPLRDLLDELGPQAAADVERALVRGIAAGRHPRTVARQMREAVGGSLVRAQRIARTEQLRVYRAAIQETYRANRHVVRRWRWSAARGPRTCMACLLMDGREFPLETPMESHPNCRCSMTPVTATWAELGFSSIGDRPPPETGQDWFLRQPAAVQRRHLGHAKYAAFKAGDLDLMELLGERRDSRWGRTVFERSLKEMLGAREAARYYLEAAD